MDPSYLNADKGPRLIAASIVFIILSALILAFRLYARLCIVHSAGTEDVLMAFAWISAVVMTVFAIEEVKYGTGRHMATLSLDEIMQGLKMLYFYIPFYRVTMTLVQCSIVLQYLRVFPSHHWIRRTCWFYLFMIVAYSIASIIANVVLCTPISAFWDITIKNPKCLNRIALWFFNSAYGIVTDLALIITPIPVLKDLQLPRRQKIALILVFALGSFTCVTSILRLHSLYVVTHTDDITWDNTEVAIWSTVEANVAIICGCLPPLKPLVMRFFPRLMATTVAASRTGGTTVQADESELLNNKTTTTRIYSKMQDTDDERQGSQDTIEHQAANRKDITVTSEFTVH